MLGSTVFITGATSGVGKVAAARMASNGAHVVATYRSETKKADLLTYFQRKFPAAKGQIDFLFCDLNSFESIEAACKEFHARYTELDVLFHNAGIMNFSFKESYNQIEQTLHVNLLAPMLITHYLIDKLSSAQRPKLIYTSSAWHKGNIRFDDLEFRNKYHRFKSYNQSKLGIILMTRFLADLFKGSNLGVYTVHPGINRTRLARDGSIAENLIFKAIGTKPEKGARNLLHLVEKHQDDLKTGAFYSKRRVKRTTPVSYDLELARQLNYRIKDYLFDYLNHSSLIYKL